MIAALLLAQLVATPSPSPSASQAPGATAVPMRQYGFVRVPDTWQFRNTESNLSYRRLGDWTHGGSAGEEVFVDMMPSYGVSLHDFVRYYGRGFSRASGFSLLSSGALPLCRGAAGWTQSYNDAARSDRSRGVAAVGCAGTLGRARRRLSRTAAKRG